MLILALETSGLAGSIALLRGEQLINAVELPATGRRHARLLVPEVKEMLSHAGLRLRDLDAVAVSEGPGSFTGLRVGVVCAKTLAYALQKPLIGINTFQALAAALPAGETCVHVQEDALRGDVFAASYIRGGTHKWENQQAGRLIPLETWLTTTAPGLATGPGLKKFGESLQQAGFRLAPVELWQPQAEHIGRLALAELAAGQSLSSARSLARPAASSARR